MKNFLTLQLILATFFSYGQDEWETWEIVGQQKDHQFYYQITTFFRIFEI